MPCDKSALFDFLSVLNEDLPKKITLVAAGGTAMTLLDLKQSTIDIDFTIPGCDRLEFEQALKSNPPGYKVDRWTDGCVFCQTLPKDYLQKSIEIKEFSHISLRALQPVDIIVTKIGRLNARDIQDIEACITKRKISETEIKKKSFAYGSKLRWTRRRLPRSLKSGARKILQK